MEAVKYRRVHSFLLSALFSVMIWQIVCYTVVDIALLDFIYLEVFMVIGNIITTFIKRKTGILPPLKTNINPLNQNPQ